MQGKEAYILQAMQTCQLQLVQAVLPCTRLCQRVDDSATFLGSLQDRSQSEYGQGLLGLWSAASLQVFIAYRSKEEATDANNEDETPKDGHYDGSSQSHLFLQLHTRRAVYPRSVTLGGGCCTFSTMLSGANS